MSVDVDVVVPILRAAPGIYGSRLPTQIIIVCVLADCGCVFYYVNMSIFILLYLSPFVCFVCMCEMRPLSLPLINSGGDQFIPYNLFFFDIALKLYQISGGVSVYVRCMYQVSVLRPCGYAIFGEMICRWWTMSTAHCVYFSFLFFLLHEWFAFDGLSILALTRYKVVNKYTFYLPFFIIMKSVKSTVNST